MLATGLAWTTVNRARRFRVSRDVAELLARHTRGAVKVCDIAKLNLRKPASRQVVAKRKRAAA